MRIFAKAMLAAALLFPAVVAAQQPSPRQQSQKDQQEMKEAADKYVWEVIRKFSQNFPDLHGKNHEGTVLLRLVIDRNGNLLESGVTKSSGSPTLDKAMLDTVRAAAPYTPMPSKLGERMVFNIPIRSTYRGE
jgi:protein TonB